MSNSYAKYQNRKISHRRILNNKISNTQNIDGQNIQCKVLNAKYRTQNIEVTYLIWKSHNIDSKISKWQHIER